MFQMLLLLVFNLVASTHQLDPVTDQLAIFMNKRMGPIGTLSTSSGLPIEKRYTESTLNTNLNTNPYFMDRMTSFVRENIPERIAHMKGTGAFGYFKTTHDISNICSADFLNEIGKKTPVVARFSVGVTGKGGPDTTATPMGFAIRLYTEQGNFDLLGLNFPLFVLKDPSTFPSFIHAMKRNPATNMADVNMFWDFATLNPASLFMFLMIFGDRGIPNSYRHMPGYPIHTYQVHNSTGCNSFVRFHIIPTEGLKYLNSTEAVSIAASNLDYYTADLYRNIGNGNYPKWKVYVQILSEEDVAKASFDVFDTSKILPIEQYPLHPIGEIVLNRNPTNQFAEIEQLAMNPSNLVPGIPGSPDKLFEARLMFYRQAQAYRLGVNYNKIPVNCPLGKNIYTYNRDGVPPVNGNGYNSPNYYPNSFDGSVPYVDNYLPSLREIYQDEPDNFDQAKEYYTNHMSAGERERFVATVITTLCYATDVIKNRAVEAFGKIHSDLGDLVAEALIENGW